MGGRNRRTRADVSFVAIATLVALPFALPLAWMLAGALRTPGLPPPRGVEWVPDPVAWGNFGAIFRLLPFGRYLLNSLVVSGLGVALTLLFGSWAGHGMAQAAARTQRRLLVLAVALLMVPLTALWLARFVLFDALGWIDSYIALLAPALMGSSPLFVLLFYWAFRRVPAEHYDAARLDGAGPLSLWARVGLPQVRPTTATIAVLAFILYWNDFLNPLIYLKSQRLYTLAVGLQQLQQLDRTNWPLLLAGAVLMVVPVVLLFLATQRLFTGRRGP